MGDALLVDVMDRISNLSNKQGDFFPVWVCSIRPLLLQPASQVGSVTPSRCQPWDGTAGIGSQKVHDVGVIQISDERCFGDESCQRLLVHQHFSARDFEGDRSTMDHVGRQVDDSKCSGTDWIFDPVVPELLPQPSAFFWPAFWIVP